MDGFPYRTKDIDGDYRRDPETATYCARCQKDLRPGQARRLVHLVEGGGFVLHPQDEAAFAAAGDRSGDLGLFPVGMDCARKIGMDWTHAADSLEIDQ